MFTAMHSQPVRWSFLLGPPILFALAACGTTTKDYEEYHRVVSSGTFSARDKPAEETALSESELLQKGYTNIGVIDIVSEKQPDPNGIKRDAARKGADLIKTEISSQPGHQLTKTCLDLLSQSNDMTGGGGGNNFAGCEKYSLEEATVTLSVVKGSLWRQGP